MRTTMRRRAAAALAAPLLAVSLAACGDDASTDDAATDAASATESASETPSEDASDAQPGTDGETVAKGDEVDPQAFTEDLREAMDSADSATMTLKMTGGGATVDMDAQVDYSTEPPTMAAVMSPSGEGKIEFRLVDKFVYMNLGQLSGGKFIKANINDPNGPLGDLTGLQESMDPVSSFESFSQGLTKVVYRGDEKVQGEQTGHYELTLDTSKIDALDDLTGTGAGAQPGMPKTLTYDLWLDDEDRMRQVRMDMGKKLGSMSMNVTDWNKPVDIKAPPADQVTTKAAG